MELAGSCIVAVLLLIPPLSHKLDIRPWKKIPVFLMTLEKKTWSVGFFGGGGKFFFKSHRAVLLIGNFLSKSKLRSHKQMINSPLVMLFTCVALAEAGLVVGPLRPSCRSSVRPSVHPSATL